jgi:hypothetical protein
MTALNPNLSPCPSERTRRAKIAKGLCTLCTDGTPSSPGKTKCEAHLAACRSVGRRTHYQHYRDYWLSQGLCARCGKRPAETNKTQCTVCATRKRRREPTPAGPWDDLTGCRVGPWQIDGLIGKPAVGDYLWAVHCVNCGKAREVLTSNVRASKCLACGGRPKGYTGLVTLFGSYRTAARKLRRPFQLSLEQFFLLTRRPCFYCGDEPRNTFTADTEWGSCLYNGIDRVDNAQGYVASNCVTCCAICNRAKLAGTQEDFLAYIRRFARNIRSGNVPCLSQPALFQAASLTLPAQG